MFNGEGEFARLFTAGELGFGEFPPESADTFRGNSFIKAKAVSDYLKSTSEYKDYYVLADDSGLSVDCLGGAPGVYSARFSGEHATDDENNAKLLGILKSLGEGCDRSAHYSCCVTCITPDGTELFAEGRVQGRIIDEPRGNDGFGYDPYFFVDSDNKTFAELDPSRRNCISHRGQAVREIIRLLKEG